LSVLIEHFAVATAALSAGRRKGGVMAELAAKYNPNPGEWGLTAGLAAGALGAPEPPPWPHLGASTITTWRPSKRGSCSTLASLDVSSLTRLRS
jgi:hypothetical protein